MTREVVADQSHGTVKAYNTGCHCAACRVANRLRQRDQRARRYALRELVNGRLTATHLPPESHGRKTTYNNWGCRCASCTVANREYARGSRARRRARRAEAT